MSKAIDKYGERLENNANLAQAVREEATRYHEVRFSSADPDVYGDAYRRLLDRIRALQNAADELAGIECSAAQLAERNTPSETEA